MCELAYHNCPVCGEEYRCTQANSECPVMNHYDGPCAKCDFYEEQAREEHEKELEREWQQEEWIKDHGWDYEG